jgi:hypothetical protein
MVSLFSVFLSRKKWGENTTPLGGACLSSTTLPITSNCSMKVQKHAGKALDISWTSETHVETQQQCLLW